VVAARALSEDLAPTPWQRQEAVTRRACGVVTLRRRSSCRLTGAAITERRFLHTRYRREGLPALTEIEASEFAGALKQGAKAPGGVDRLRQHLTIVGSGFQGSVMRQDMQKSAIEEIKELKAQLESKTERAKVEALDRASEAISFLRELGMDNDTILKDLGFRGRSKTQETREGKPPKEGPCPICNFQTAPPHDGRSHRGQTKKKPLTAEELEQKGLTKI
jgi:hypothetical protein